VTRSCEYKTGTSADCVVGREILQSK